MADSTSTLRIAICGGGLAGATLFHALLKQPSLDVHIFESAAGFKEAGAAVGLTKNAQSALALIGPSVVRSLERAGAVPQRGVQLVLAQGPDAGETVARVGGDENVVSVVHRAAFLKELLADAPPERMHTSKKLLEINQTDEDQPLTLRFSDKSEHTCDVLVGADGIHSTVRKYILGDSDPAASPVSAGWWAAMTLKPYEEVAALVGKQYMDMMHPGEVARIGDGAVIFHNPLSEGKLAQFVAAVACDETGEQWFGMKDANEIRSVFAKWPSELSHAIEKLLCDQPSQPVIYMWEHLPARTYTRGKVCIIGDAAHATTPWQGSGAGMSVEDSLVLSTLLERARSPAEAAVALQVYDSVRKERTQRVVESSKTVGRLATNQDSEAGLNAAKLREDFRSRWDFILDMDVAQHNAEALAQMETELQKDTI